MPPLNGFRRIFPRFGTGPKGNLSPLSANPKRHRKWWVRISLASVTDPYVAAAAEVKGPGSRGHGTAVASFFGRRRQTSQQFDGFGFGGGHVLATQFCVCVEQGNKNVCCPKTEADDISLLLLSFFFLLSDGRLEYSNEPIRSFIPPFFAKSCARPARRLGAAQKRYIRIFIDVTKRPGEGPGKKKTLIGEVAPPPAVPSSLTMCASRRPASASYLLKVNSAPCLFFSFVHFLIYIYTGGYCRIVPFENETTTSEGNKRNLRG